MMDRVNKEKLPDHVETLINSSNIERLHATMMNTGKVFSNFFDYIGPKLQPKACHDLMQMHMFSYQKHKFVVYTSAYADYASVTDEKPYNLVEGWWYHVRPNGKAKAPHEWFDEAVETKEFGLQLASVAMCATIMIQLIPTVNYDW